MKQLIFLGAPGSGKGTQAKFLVEKQSFNHVSTGDLLREEIKKGTALGKKVDGILKEGGLVDDDTVLELLKSNCDLDNGAYIFDGYPRNLEQAEALTEKILQDYDFLAVYFDMPTDILINRLTNRRICRACGAIYNLLTNAPKKQGVCDSCSGKDIYQRDDDKEEVIKNRLNVYNEAIGPVLKFYKNKNRLLEVDASGPISDVYKFLEEKVTKC